MVIKYKGQVCKWEIGATETRWEPKNWIKVAAGQEGASKVEPCVCKSSHLCHLDGEEESNVFNLADCKNFLLVPYCPHVPVDKNPGQSKAFSGSKCLS